MSRGIACRAPTAIPGHEESNCCSCSCDKLCNWRVCPLMVRRSGERLAFRIPAIKRLGHNRQSPRAANEKSNSLFHFFLFLMIPTLSPGLRRFNPFSWQFSSINCFPSMDLTLQINSAHTLPEPARVKAVIIPTTKKIHLIRLSMVHLLKFDVMPPREGLDCYSIVTIFVRVFKPCFEGM